MEVDNTEKSTSVESAEKEVDTTEQIDNREEVSNNTLQQPMQTTKEATTDGPEAGDTFRAYTVWKNPFGYRRNQYTYYNNKPQYKNPGEKAAHRGKRGNHRGYQGNPRDATTFNVNQLELIMKAAAKANMGDKNFS